MIRHLWAVCLKADNLWIKWVHIFILKRQSIWQFKIPNEASWTIMKLFKLRVVVQPWIKYIIGNDLSTQLWVDYWHTLGPLFQRFGDSMGFNIGRSMSAKVASIIHNGTWKWPRPRSAITREIVANTEIWFLM